MTKDDPGGDGGYPAPEPNIDYEPVRIDVDSVAGFGQLLTASGANLGTATPAITELLKDPEGDQLGQYSGFPIGRDSRQESLHAIGLAHSEQMAQMNTLLTQVQTGIQNLGLITQRVVGQFGDQDGLNAASVNQVDAAINGHDPHRSEA